MNKMLSLYSGKKSNSRIIVGQFAPRDLPDRPDWPNRPILTQAERELLLAGIFKQTT